MSTKRSPRRASSTPRSRNCYGCRRFAKRGSFASEQVASATRFHGHPQCSWMHPHLEALPALDWLSIDVKGHRTLGLDRRATDLPDRAAADPMHGAIE